VIVGQNNSPFSDSLATEENGLSIDNLQARLDILAGAKSHALDMSNYIKDYQNGNDKLGAGRPTDNNRLATNIATCGNLLVFKHYITKDEVRLAGAKTCRKALLCPFCARGRATRYAQAYHSRVGQVISKNPLLVPYMVTVTVADGEQLHERFTHLHNSLKKMMQLRRDTLKGRKYCEAVKASGGVYSIEVKRGQNSKLWHPHAHAIWLCEEAPNSQKLSQEWKEITGDSFIVDVRPINGFEGLLEVFKYALKFSEMTLADNWEAFKTLSNKRLVNSFGDLRGVELPESVLDAPIEEEDLPFILYFFGYTKGGYTFLKEEKNDVKIG